MKISSLAVALIASSYLAEAFVAPKPLNGLNAAFTAGTSLSASVAEPESRVGRSKEEISKELSSGKLLEGGQVIDFGAVKGESRAETALSTARTTLLGERGETSIHSEVDISSGVLGINDEVIAEVGYPLAQFADPTVVQKCASFLRSAAPNGFFEDATEPLDVNFTAEEKADFSRILRKAYEESGEVTSAFAKTFYMGTQLLPEAAREAIWAVYVWCRRTDEIVDAPRDNDEEMLRDLSSWEIRLENLWKYGAVEDVFDLCLLDVRIKYPNLSITPFVDMIRGMLMDVPELGQDRYDTFDELHLYCYRVAGTVGLMSMPVFGCAPGYNEDVARYVSSLYNLLSPPPHR